MTERALSDRPTKGTPADQCETMADVRREIDRLDRVLVELLAERQTYIERAGHIKPARDTVRDEARIEDVVAKVLAEAQEKGLSADVAEAVWRIMIDRFIAHEFDVFDGRSRPAAE